MQQEAQKVEQQGPNTLYRNIATPAKKSNYLLWVVIGVGGFFLVRKLFK